MQTAKGGSLYRGGSMVVVGYIFWDFFCGFCRIQVRGYRGLLNLVGRKGK